MDAEGMIRGTASVAPRGPQPVPVALRRGRAAMAAVLPAPEPAGPRLTFHGLIGRTAAMQQVFAAIERFAPHARTTLVTGETGTGKAAVARTFYRLGPRRGGAFVAVDCADADAAATWNGPTGSAVDTTLFFDDVIDLPPVLQTRLAQRLAGDDGGSGADSAVHVIAATSHDLRAAIGQGRFRADLYYRLGVFALHLPPLRDRLADLPDLATAFLRDAAARLRLRVHGLTPAAVRVLQAQPWPGNLRELRNVIERACVLTDGDTVGESAVRASLLDATATAMVSSAGSAVADPSARLDDAQRAHVRAVLHAARGNKTRAATELGISRRALYRLMDRLGA